MLDPASVLPQVIEIARGAGDIIRNIYQKGDFVSEIKDDKTPVTSADYAAHHYIMDALTELTPEIPVLSEEQADISLAEREDWQTYWLVDPLDGTQEFVSGSGDFATEIALVQNNQPVLGVVYGPIVQILYAAVKGQGAFKEQGGLRTTIKSRHYPQLPEHIRVATSRVQRPALLQAILNCNYHYKLYPMGSASLKSCMVAEGAADCYIRVGPTGEWDTGAPQIILQEAGGGLKDLHLRSLSYNQRDSLENPNFISLGDPQLPWRDILKNPS